MFQSLLSQTNNHFSLSAIFDRIENNQAILKMPWGEINWPLSYLPPGLAQEQQLTLEFSTDGSLNDTFAKRRRLLTQLLI